MLYYIIKAKKSYEELKTITNRIEDLDCRVEDENSEMHKTLLASIHEETAVSYFIHKDVDMAVDRFKNFINSIVPYETLY